MPSKVGALPHQNWRKTIGEFNSGHGRTQRIAKVSNSPEPYPWQSPTARSSNALTDAVTGSLGQNIVGVSSRRIRSPLAFWLRLGLLSAVAQMANGANLPYNRDQATKTRDVPPALMPSLGRQAMAREADWREPWTGRRDPAPEPHRAYAVRTGTLKRRRRNDAARVPHSVVQTDRTDAADDGTDRDRAARTERGVDGAGRHARNLNRIRRDAFSEIHVRSTRYDRADRVLVKALQRSGHMTQDAADQASFSARRFVDSVAQSYGQFADEESLYEYMQRRLSGEAASVSDFLNDKNLIVRRITRRPNETDDALIDYAVSLLNGTTARETLPVDTGQPFIKYVDTLLDDLSWIDWNKAQRRIENPLQAITALHNYHRAYDTDMPKLDGLALGEDFARGARNASVASTLAALGSWSRTRFDKAALLYCLATEPDLWLASGTHDAMPLGEQLCKLREAFLIGLRKEWQLSRMFVPNADRSNVFVDHNALANARGKTFQNLVDDPSVLGIPGMSDLHPQTRTTLVKRKLDRLGESTEYTFGSLQHGVATVLKRSLLLQGKAPPDSFGTEAQMMEKFLALCQAWDLSQSLMHNPKVMLAQYLAQAGGEHPASAAATPQQKLNALETYLKDRWLANYGAPPMRFDRGAAALKILQTAFGETKSERDLTDGKQEFARAIVGSKIVEERKVQTPLERFLYLADSPTRFSDTFVFGGQTFFPRAQLQNAEDEYNEQLKRDPWIEARAKENVRISGRGFNDAAIREEHDRVLADFHAETEDERERVRELKVVRALPFIGNLWRFGEGLYRGDVDETIGAIPVIGNAYELEEGIRHLDARRTIGAIPVFGSGYQLADALRNGDGLDVALSATGFLFDVGLLRPGSGGAAGRPSLAPAEHIVMKESELPAAHAIGLRNYVSVTKTLGIPLREAAEPSGAPASNARPAGGQLAPGDPYGIESVVTRDDVPAQGLPPTTNALAFGPRMEQYRVAGPTAGSEPNEAGVFEESNHKYIKEDGHFYRVRYDEHNATWRVFRADNAAKPAIPVRYQEGQWRIHHDVGLKGGAPMSASELDTLVDKLLNPQLASEDKYLAKRRQTIAEAYQRMQYGKKPYEQSFDVEGNLAGHEKSPEVHPGTGKAYFDIRTHGSQTEVLSIKGKAATPSAFADEIRQYVKYYRPGTPIRLLACEAGRGGVFSFAQRFANAMNVPVKAYTVDVHLIDKSATLEQHAKVFEPFSSALARRAWS